MLVKPSSTRPAANVAADATAALFKPLRLNFAQVCLYCGVRWCASAGCVELHAESVWGPCEDCDGFGQLVDCTACVHGVAEYYRADLSVRMGRALPDRLPESPVYVVTGVSAAVAR
jgi:hypothetical protein